MKLREAVHAPKNRSVLKKGQLVVITKGPNKNKKAKILKSYYDMYPKKVRQEDMYNARNTYELYIIDDKSHSNWYRISDIKPIGKIK